MQMVKIYLGNNTYEYHLMSGKIVVLTDIELNELLYETLKKKKPEETQENFEFESE